MDIALELFYGLAVRMTDLTVAPLSDPTDIYRHRDAIYGTDMLIAALKGLDFFTWLSRGCKAWNRFASISDSNTDRLMS